MTTTTNNLDVYSLNDSEESDPDPIYEGDISGLIDVLGNVTLEFLFHDDDMRHDAYNVRNADNDVIAIAYTD